MLNQLIAGALGGALLCLHLGASDAGADVRLADDGHCRGDGHQGKEEDEEGAHGDLVCCWG